MDVEAHREGYVRGNDYALPYLSNFTKTLDIEDDDLAMLAHANCCFLSTRGVPPTLVALKQHAQSLCYLISCLEPQAAAAVEVNGKNSGARAAPQSRAGAWDWLFDMQSPYRSDEPDHWRPLTDLMNQVASRHDVTGTKYHCALEAHRPSTLHAPRRPYASHANLLMHANECLERLDHEYSTTGGLLSLLPTDGEHDADEMRAARNSLVGQWLSFTQHLVGRMHELEIAYGNALDALAGEAVSPLQSLGAALHGPDARSGREIAYPQDRWVLVNAGDDVFDYLHKLFDRSEALVAEKEKIWRDGGRVIGERLWMEERGGKTYARGIVPLDVTTRYYRLKGQGPGTIFVCPAWDEHPAVTATKQLETRPTVVTVAEPRFPPRATDLERRLGDRADRATEIEVENIRLVQKAHQRDAELSHLRDRTRYETERNEALTISLDAKDKPKAQLIEEKIALAKELKALKQAHQQALDKTRADLVKSRAEVQRLTAANERLAAQKAKIDGDFKLFTAKP